VLHARALPDNPYDGHTLRDVIDRTETLTGCAIERAYVDRGYRGHDAQNPRRIFISGQKRGYLRRLRYAGDGDMAAAATSLSRDLRSWSCGSGSIPIVDKMCSQR
jgi:hypothetical protein